MVVYFGYSIFTVRLKKVQQSTMHEILCMLMHTLCRYVYILEHTATSDIDENQVC